MREHDMTNTRKTQGFTLVEILIVVVLIGIMLAVGIPYFRTGTVKGDLRSGADAIAQLHAVAKQTAIQRGRTARLVMNAGANTVVVTATNAAGTAQDTVGKVEDLNSRFGVTFTTTNATLVFTPRGIGGESAGTTIIVSKAGFADTITISAAGRLLR
jgi:prepilin-type N-terminal cleavage/methylation domain-containing protein